MIYYSTKTFKLRMDSGNFDYFCAYCGMQAETRIESDDRDATYHYSCSKCVSARKEKDLIDKIFHHRNEISKLLATIGSIATSETMIRSREYENKLRRLNAEYFGGDDEG